MITVSHNNVLCQFDASRTLDSALEDWGYHDINRIAVAINQLFVPREAYAKINLNDGDEIDIVQPISGG